MLNQVWVIWTQLKFWSGIISSRKEKNTSAFLFRLFSVSSVIAKPFQLLCCHFLYCHFFQRRRKMKHISNESVDDLSQVTATRKVASVCVWKCVSFYYGGRLLHYSGVLPIPIILLWGIAVGPKPSAKREVIKKC